MWGGREQGLAVKKQETSCSTEEKRFVVRDEGEYKHTHPLEEKKKETKEPASSAGGKGLKTHEVEGGGDRRGDRGEDRQKGREGENQMLISSPRMYAAVIDVSSFSV